MDLNDLKGKHCVVLGGGGFIGRSLIQCLHRHGASVRGFGRVSRFALPSTTYPWIYGEFQDKLALANAIDGADVVFHLAAGNTPERSNAAPIEDLEASVAGTINLLDICRAEGVQRVIFASSGGTVYGCPKMVPIPEDSPTDPISAYGINKLAIEKYLHLYEHVHGLNYAVLRLSNPFGPFQDPLRRHGLVAATLMRLMADEAVEIWGDGTVVRDYLYVDDLAEAFARAALYTGGERVFNIGSGIGLSVNDIVERCAKALGIAEPKRVYRHSRKADVPCNVLDIGRAAAELHWQPWTPWSEAVASTITWLRAEPSVRAYLERNENA